MPNYNSHAERVAAESTAGRARLDHHAAGHVHAAELLKERLPRAGDENVIRDGGMPAGPVNADAYVEAVERARAENPEQAAELSTAAEVKPKRRPRVSAEDALASLDEILKG